MQEYGYAAYFVCSDVWLDEEYLRTKDINVYALIRTRKTGWHSTSDVDDEYQLRSYLQQLQKAAGSASLPK